MMPLSQQRHRASIIQGIVQIIRTEGPLPTTALQDKLWDMNIRTSSKELMGVFKSVPGKKVFLARPRPTNGGKKMIMYYDLLFFVPEGDDE
jgi:hypothetical protein